MRTALALVVAGCTCRPDPAIVEAFREAEALARATPAPVRDGWAPDLVLHLGRDTVASLVETELAAVDRDVRGEIPVGLGVTVNTRLTLDALTLAPSTTCTGCWSALAELAGTVGYESGVLGRGAVPVAVSAVVDLSLETHTTPASYVIRAVPERVTDVDLRVKGLPRSLVDRAETEVRARVSRALAELPPIVVTEIARTGLPVRAVRVAPEGAGLRVELLSEAPAPGRVPVHDPGLRVGWQLDASVASLLSIARREAFSAPRQKYDLVPVPESLAVEGSRFRLGLRLWRLSAPGWWRDYAADGTVEVVFGEIALSAERVVEGGRSPGAGRADPLALLGEGVILDTITDVLQRTVPASGATTVQGRDVSVTVERIGGAESTISRSGGAESTISVRGMLSLGPPTR